MDLGTKSENKYLKALEVTFKPKSGEYEFFDGTQSIASDNFEGIVVGTGWQLRGNIGTPSKKKSTNYLSEDFDMETLTKGQISVREFNRDGASNTNRPMGKKTYQEWKDDGLQLNRTVFVVKADDMETIYKLCFSKVASIPVGKQIEADMPNFVCKFGVSETPFETDNGEFMVPEITKLNLLPATLEAQVGEWLKKVKTALSKKPPMAISEDKQTETVTRDDIPF